jgi:hypothetical protein
MAQPLMYSGAVDTSGMMHQLNYINWITKMVQDYSNMRFSTEPKTRIYFLTTFMQKYPNTDMTLLRNIIKQVWVELRDQSSQTRQTERVAMAI